MYAPCDCVVFFGMFFVCFFFSFLFFCIIRHVPGTIYIINREFIYWHADTFSEYLAEIHISGLLGQD